jgi:SAM-dependent methyltransferase
MDRKAHWEGLYATRTSTEVSWYQARPARSLELIALAEPGPATATIDVGGGDSTLVDALLALHWGHVTVLDISGTALARARARLGARADEVTWIEADITGAALPPQAFDVWHDRAVFHFLTEADDRRCYVGAVRHALRPGGLLVMATFAPTGPTRCSGLDVVRYAPETLLATFGDDFDLVARTTDVHVTPTGREQVFTYATMRQSRVSF